jgi:putative oxidoreductase
MDAEDMQNATVTTSARWFLRVALAAGFLSAVADRFGLWGPAGAPHVAWGAWRPFVNYVAKLNWFAHGAFIPILAWTSTGAEVVLAITLAGSYDGLLLPLACFY